MKKHERPNIIVFLTDDQGYADLSCMGTQDLHTPHLDALAAGGVRFTDWYANGPVCSPTRASLLTGRYPARAGVKSIIGGHRRNTGLPTTTPTIAGALRKIGYRTAMFGKWHLGMAPQHQPHEHGFDHWSGFLAGCVDYYSHIFYWGQGININPCHDLWEDGQEIYENGHYLTDFITSRAVGYINNHARHANDAPFFLYLPYNAPHYPMHAPQKYLDRFSHLPWDRRIMAAMLSAVDDGVGVVVSALKHWGMRENTLIFFTSDNGPSRESRNWLDSNEDPYYGGTTGLLRGHKASLFEGGIRVPALVNWPSRISGNRVCNIPGATMDLFPTLLHAAGGDISEYDLDGCDMMPAWCNEAPAPERDLFWEYGAQTAMRRGRWKLVLDGLLVEGTPPEDAVHLADLDADMGERCNLKNAHPNIAEELRREAASWRAETAQYWETHFSELSATHTGHPDAV